MHPKDAADKPKSRAFPANSHLFASPRIMILFGNPCRTTGYWRIQCSTVNTCHFGLNTFPSTLAFLSIYDGE